MNGKLGGCMHLHLGSGFPHNLCNTQILYNQRIDAVFAGNFQRAQHLIIFSVIHHGVDCHMHLDAALLAQAGRLGKGLLVKVFGVSAGI